MKQMAYPAFLIRKYRKWVAEGVDPEALQFQEKFYSTHLALCALFEATTLFLKLYIQSDLIFFSSLRDLLLLKHSR